MTYKPRTLHALVHRGLDSREKFLAVDPKEYAFWRNVGKKTVEQFMRLRDDPDAERVFESVRLVLNRAKTTSAEFPTHDEPQA